MSRLRQIEEIKQGSQVNRQSSSIGYNDKVFRNESYIKKFTRISDD